MSYGLGDATTDEQKAQALEAQAADIERVGKELEATAPGSAVGLKAQADSMRQQAAAFRQVSGLPPAGSWSLGKKIGVAAGAVALVAGVVWLAGGSRR